jgi:hypothetical protein
MYGDAKVTLVNGKLVVKLPAFEGDLEHWHYDTFRSTWRDRNAGKAFVAFALDPQGKVELMKLPDLNISFKRSVEAAPPAQAVPVSEAQLARLVGKYTLQGAPLDVSVEIVGGQLKASVPGQPVYSLIPLSETKFQIAGAPEGFFVSFELAGERVSQVFLEQGQRPRMTLLPKQ